MTIRPTNTNPNPNPIQPHTCPAVANPCEEGWTSPATTCALTPRANVNAKPPQITPGKPHMQHPKIDTIANTSDAIALPDVGIPTAPSNPAPTTAPHSGQPCPIVAPVRL